MLPCRAMHLWLKAGHLIAMVAWFAGMFYIFRLFVNQVDHRNEPESVAMLKGMAERLYRIIITPAMIATWVFGLAMLAWTPAYLSQPWLWAKLLFVLGLSGYHGYVGRAPTWCSSQQGRAVERGRVRRRFAADDLYLSSRQCRIRNEIPSLFLVVIVLLAVLRPGG